jgi:hypothetical protein
MTFDPRAAAMVQFVDSLLATVDLPRCAGHPYLVALLLLSSIYFVVQGAWNLAT